MNRILTFLLVISFVVILGVGGYYLRSKQQISPTTGETATLPLVQPQTGGGAQSGAPAQTGAQGALDQKLAVVSEIPALDYFVDKGSNAFVIQPDGKVSKVSGSKSETLSNSVIANISKASFSFDGKRIMALVRQNLSTTKVNIFDAEQKSWRVLPDTVQNPVWSPSDHKIVFVSAKASGNAISTLDTDNAKASPVEIIRIHQQDMNLDWQSPSKILIGDEPSGNWASSLWSLDIGRKTMSPLMVDRLGLETVWSSSSPPFGLAFYAGANGRGGQLYLVDQNGKQIQLLNFLTLPSKCAFYNKAAQKASSAQATSSSSTKTPSTLPMALTFVCAVPRDTAALNNNLLPDSYLKKSLFTSDDFFEVDVSSGNVKSIFSDPAQNIDADDIKISNQAVFFINRYDQKVYSLQLPK